jgi:hypothetical protein
MVGKTTLALTVLPLLCVMAAAAEEPIRFAPKMFGNNELAVEVSGTLTGTGVAYPNNTHVVTCVKDRKECSIIAVEADGTHVTRVTGPAYYPVIKWTEQEIVAQEETSFSCSRTTITITRKREQLLWVQEPVNQTTPFCAKSETRILKWTIEHPEYWWKMQGK